MSSYEHGKDHEAFDGKAPCEHRDSAWSFVVGNTTDEESASFLGHLVEGCAACGAEVTRARSVVADLDVALADRTLSQEKGSTPGPGIRERLLASVARGTQTSFASHVEQASGSPLVPTEMHGVAIAAGSEEGWKSTDLEGIEFKTLAEDAQRRTATALVRMAPGSAYPAHRHAAREECFVLSGDLSFGEQRMQAGDYQVAEEGSVHPLQRTKQGCLLLIVSSLDDEPV